MTEFEKLKIDLKRNSFILSKFVCVIIRLERINRFTRLVAKPFRLLFLNCFLNVEIPRGVIIGEGIRIPHPYNIVINKSTKMGKYCTIFHNVTIAGIDYAEGGGAYIGDYCFIGVGSVLVGEISVGESTIISALSLLSDNLLPNTFYKNSKVYINKTPYKEVVVKT